MPQTEITTATVDDIDELAPLFDAYRVFYRQPTDLARARSFLLERLERLDSIIFLARVKREAAGLIQMYPAFSSVSTARIWILNDLFVAEGNRRLGVARDLMQHAVDWGKSHDAVRLILETARDNAAAKSLYEELGWTVDREFDRYSIELT